jgi:predicted nucleic acid-binding protein
MSGRAFLDTNIFVYDVDTLAPSAKRRIARDLIRDALTRRQSIISYQVIQEFLAVATRKFSASITVPDAQSYVNTVFRVLLGVHASVELFQEALDIRARYQIDWYDSVIVAAASEANCSVIYTEDLQHGAKINGVRIENPFRVTVSN